MLITGRQCRPETILLWVAALFLAFGIMVYALDRDSTAYFLPAWLASDAGLSLFGPLGDHLPTFVHPLAFILITAAVLRPWPRLLPVICATWFVVECAFELGQLEPLGGRIAAAVPPWFEGVPVLEATAGYFSLGTFDSLDVLSIGLGTITAYLFVRFFEKGEPQ